MTWLLSMPTTSAGPRRRTFIVTDGVVDALTLIAALRSTTARCLAPSVSGVLMVAATPWRTHGRNVRDAAGWSVGVGMRISLDERRRARSARIDRPAQCDVGRTLPLGGEPRVRHMEDVLDIVFRPRVFRRRGRWRGRAGTRHRRG